MSRVFNFEHGKFFSNMLLHAAIQGVFYAIILALLFYVGTAKLIYILFFAVLILYMMFLNISYNPKKLSFDEKEVTIQYGKLIKQVNDLKINRDEIVKATVTTRNGKLHSFIMLHKFTDSKVRPIKVHLRYLEEPSIFEAYIKEYFPTIYEANIER